MSKAYNSPTARLLQNSRLFSIPRPLPQPQLEQVSVSGTNFASDTATLPYPVHQAIATPATSHHRGDWGLKRPLPGKTTKSSGTPTVRVLAQDTNDHITDFESAGDHARTVAKWVEMGIPLIDSRTKPGTINSGAAASGRSVYEADLDNTDTSLAGAVNKQRWKYTGPWIAGMQEAEFETFLSRNVNGAKSREKWLDHIANFFAKEEYNRQRLAARETGSHFGSFESAMPDVQVEILQKRIEAAAQKLAAPELKQFDAQNAKDEAALWAETSKTAMTGEDANLEQARLIQQRDQRRDQIEEAAKARVPAEVQQMLEKAMQEAEIWQRVDEARAIMADGDRKLINTRAEQNLRRSSLERKRHEDLQAGLMENASDYIFNEDQAATALDAITNEAAQRVVQLLSEGGNHGTSEARSLLQEWENRYRGLIAEKQAIRAAWESSHLQSLYPDGQRLAEYQKELRAEHKEYRLSSTLSRLIVDFFDLPSNNAEDTVDKGIRSRVKTFALADKLSNLGIGDLGPGHASTHGAAGLSYLRTNAVMENHPTHGPQWKRSPILARVLKPRNTSTGVDNYAKLGVAGFVVNDSETGSAFNDRARGGRASRNDPTQAMDPDTVGGGKIWVHPQFAYLDEQGRLQVRIQRGDSEAVAVRTGDVAEIQQSKDQTLTGSHARPPRDLGNFARSRPVARYGAGFSNPKVRAEQQSTTATGGHRVQGFDEALNRRRQSAGRAGNRADGQSASRRITELMTDVPKA